MLEANPVVDRLFTLLVAYHLLLNLDLTLFWTLLELRSIVSASVPRSVMDSFHKILAWAFSRPDGCYHFATAAHENSETLWIDNKIYSALFVSEGFFIQFTYLQLQSRIGLRYKRFKISLPCQLQRSLKFGHWKLLSSCVSALLQSFFHSFSLSRNLRLQILYFYVVWV